MNGSSPLFRTKVGLARLVGGASRITGRGGGTTLPGRVLLRMEPEALRLLGQQIEGSKTVISATNGKTTTAALLGSMLTDAGRAPVHNRAGSNMTWGVATAMLSQRGSEGLFEVDEAWLPRVAEQLRPDFYLLCNLFRDQLDRHGELETLAENWAAMIEKRLADSPSGSAGSVRPTPPVSVLLNADDPVVADLGRDGEGRPRPGVTYFGIEDERHAISEPGIAHDAKNCRRCGHPYEYEYTLLGHLGHYRCPNCGVERPTPEVAATRIELHGMEGSELSLRIPGGRAEISLPLPGLYNAYNALAAFAAALRLGLAPGAAAESVASTAAAFGRVETVPIGGKQLSMLLIKNPTGATEVLRTLGAAAENEPIDLWIALNDRIADGRDISWVWDADFERIANRVRRVTCAGTRAEELALRLKYAGWPEEAVSVEREIEASLDHALAEAPARLFALPTYTALLELRGLLNRRGLVEDYLG